MEYQVNYNGNNDFFVKENSKRHVIDLQKRLLSFSVNVVKFLFYLPALKEIDVIRYQLSKSASSIGANYEESQAASYAEFYQRIQICLREARETNYWLQIVHKLDLCSTNFRIKHQQEYSEKLKALLTESNEISLIFGAVSSKIKKSLKQ